MKQRKNYIDYLRIFSAIGIVILHVASEFWYRREVGTPEWSVMNLYESAVRWAVAVFIMISGSLFLSRDIPIKTLYTKYIPRMAISYVVWSLLYATVDHYIKNGIWNLSFSELIKRTIDGGFHMWFIPMIIGLYMCVPIFKEIIKSERITRYFLALSFVFTFLIPQITQMVQDFIGGRLAWGMTLIDQFVALKVEMNPVMGYPFYFILGYYITTVEITPKQRRFLYSLGIIGFLGTVLFTEILSGKAGTGQSQYYDYCSLGTLFEAVAVHTWFRSRSYPHEGRNAVAHNLSQYTFGVYLVHVILMNILLFRLRLPALFGSAMISVPVISLMVILLSFGVTWLIHKIPVLKKWIV